MLLETGRLLLVFIDNCELLHLVRRQVSSQAGFNLFKNLVSRELFRILENFHFSISISKHFDFTFHFSKKSESILISLCTSRKRVKAFIYHSSLLELPKTTLAGACIVVMVGHLNFIGDKLETNIMSSRVNEIIIFLGPNIETALCNYDKFLKQYWNLSLTTKPFYPNFHISP